MFNKSLIWEQTAPLLANLIPCVYEAKFIQNLIKDKRSTHVKVFNLINHVYQWCSVNSQYRFHQNTFQEFLYWAYQFCLFLIFDLGLFPRCCMLSFSFYYQYIINTITNNLWSWIILYLCTLCISPLKVSSYADHGEAYSIHTQTLSVIYRGQWFSPATLVSVTRKPTSMIELKYCRKLS